jgi:putative ABC transport system permease protein
MELRPILSAMRRNKVGAIVIAVQMAVTLAILCNALFIIEQRLSASRRPSGVDEANLFAIVNQWVGAPPDLAARLKTDLAALRAIPNVVDAYATNSYPLSDGGSTEGVSTKPDVTDSPVSTAEYMADTHGLDTLGVRLIAGRNFTPDEVIDKAGFNDLASPRALIITRALAEKLFPGQSAVGKTLYGPERKGGGTTIVGVIDRLQVPWSGVGLWGSKFFYSSMIVPFNYMSSYSQYLVRAKPGHRSEVMLAARKTLLQINRGRVLEKVQPLTDARTEAYKDDRALAVMLGVVCAALVLVTGFGIVGLTSYWVSQRRRQIGIRRALGATRHAIVRYFQTENLLIAGAGSAAGVGLAVALNLWMVGSFEMERLHFGYAVIGAVLVLLLGQISVLWPALRASAVPPALATRNA